MKRKGIGAILILALVLSLCLVIAAPVAAEIVSVMDDVVIVTAPDDVSDVSLGSYESDDNISVFNEEQSVYIEDLEAWVDSHLIHQDSIGEAEITLDGSVTFDNEIVDVIILSADLDDSDDIFGLDDVTYPVEDAEPSRGLELSDDSYTINGGTITVHLHSSTAVDQIRVLTIAKIAVDIDIKPDSDKNPINNNGHGVIPVAILGSEDFDVTQINVETVQLEGMDIKMAGKSGKLLAHIEDVNDDGYLDLMVQIQDEAGVLDGTSATLTGNLDDGMPIEGTDSICLVPKKS